MRIRTEGRRVRRFIEHLTLGGSYLGQRFKLLPWQHEVLNDLYRVNADGSRKQGPRSSASRVKWQTQLAAALALYHLCADTRDSAPKVVCAANTRDQARLSFREARRMVQMSPVLKDT